ncbi:LppX_LprAFG lipoprotein [Janibacter terrae]|uniref:LppX_LprAFG lipoprotein n=1 Tax=Janibacter terrae TaxID=103817 RepID=A0ABZ2FG40_9MICO
MRTTSLTIVAASAALALAACGGDGGPGPTAGSGASSTDAATSQSSGDSPSSTGGRSNSSTPTPGTADPSSATPTSSSTTAGSSTAAPTATSTYTGTPFDAREFTDRLEAAVAANPTVHIDVEATLGGQQATTATGVQDLEADALDMDVDLSGQELGYRLVDGQYYLEQPPKWVRVAKGSGNPLVEQTLDQVNLLSMRSQLDAFVAGVEKAGTKGEEDVDGTTTTHYTAQVDTDKAFAELGMERGDGVPETVVYDVWLDEDDLIRKMSFDLNGLEATLTASRWGEPVTITKPRPSQIARAG